MATNSSKSPEDEKSKENILKPRSTCSCSNISIMQLFHEMKQKFPKVPDHVVSELVTENCHNRTACLASLEEAVLGTPVAAQVYPAQSIHSNSSSLKRKIKNKLGSLCSSSSESVSSSRENSVDTKSEINNNNNNKISDMSADNNSVNNINNNRVVNRPNTLAIQSNIGVGLQHFSRPTRAAPPPPVSTSSATTSPNLGEALNVSLNVTVSPVSSRPRHTSTLSVQPEPPYPCGISQQPINNSCNQNNNNRSSTSVNLTLRQPGSSPQSPINIIASPRLTYSSRSYDAKQGYESRLEITVGDDGFRSFSAMRTQAPQNYYSIDGQRVDAGGSGGGCNNRMGGNMLGHSSILLEEVTVSNQLEQKQRLSDEVVSNKEILHTIKREIRVLEKPLSNSDVNHLQNEIMDLQRECLRMSKEIEEKELEGDKEMNGRFLADLNSLDINDPSRAPTSNRPPRPPRPPPPRRPNPMSQHPPYTNEELGDNNSGEQWICNMCTFQNHELMTRCEVCAMPKISGTQISYLPPPLQNAQLLQAAASAPSTSSSLNANRNNNNYPPVNVVVDAVAPSPNNINNSSIINPNNTSNNNNNNILSVLPKLCMNPTSQTPVPTNGNST